MARPRVSAGGGVAAITYALRMGRQAGGLWRLYGRMRHRNACKTCALGMGGQRGGMVNEAGHFPEVCKKSVQAQAGDMQGADQRGASSARTPLARARRAHARPQLERLGRLAFPIARRGGATRHFRRIVVGRGARPRGRGALRAAPPERGLLLLLGARRATRPPSCCSWSRAPTARPTSTTARSTATTRRAWRWRRCYGSGTASIVLDDLAQRRPGAGRRRQSGEQPSAAHHAAGRSSAAAAARSSS